jgi:hypothetical protein
MRNDRDRIRRMHFNLTTFLATWGALLSTFGLGWNLYRDLLDKARLKVSAHMRRLVQSADGRWYSVALNLPVEGASAQVFVVVDVINAGRRPVQWTGWGGKHYKPESGKDSFAIIPMGLPKMLNEGETHSEFTGEINPVLDNVNDCSFGMVPGKSGMFHDASLEK